MHFEQGNVYEDVFACWLAEHHIRHVRIDQITRFNVEQQGVKNFDFLLRPDSDAPVLVEVKGRTFHGDSLKGLKGLDGWTTLEDVEALGCWLAAFREEKPSAEAVFVFVFRIDQIDVETDGQAVYDFDGQRFLLLVVLLESYRAAMKPRSAKWRTVMLAAEDFRRYAKPVRDVLLPQRSQRNKRLE